MTFDTLPAHFFPAYSEAIGSGNKSVPSFLNEKLFIMLPFIHLRVKLPDAFQPTYSHDRCFMLISNF